MLLQRLQCFQGKMKLFFLPDQHHKLVHPPPVDPHPLPAHGPHERRRKEERSRLVGAEAGDHRPDGFGQLLLNERLVGHPEAIVKTLPKSHHLNL